MRQKQVSNIEGLKMMEQQRWWNNKDASESIVYMAGEGARNSGFAALYSKAQ